MKNKIKITDHYKRLVFFNFHRFEKNNYKKMSEYFAKIFVNDIQKFTILKNKEMLDIGGASGEFCKLIYKYTKTKPTNLDPFPHNLVWKKTIIGYANKLPFEDNIFDIVLCRGVLEHIPPNEQQPSINEAFRVLKRGGIGYFVIPPWYNPHAGHNFKPFHIFPFKVGKFLRETIFREKIDKQMFTGKKIEAYSYDDYNLYKITFRKMERMLKKSGFEIVDTLDTHFRLHFMTKMPGLKEILVPAVAFIVKKPKNEN